MINLTSDQKDILSNLLLEKVKEITNIYNPDLIEALSPYKSDLYEIYKEVIK